MSLKTWKAEFFNQPLSPSRLQKSSHKRLVKLCIQKWEGLRLKNLERHGLEVDFTDITEKGTNQLRIPIDSTTCALCLRTSNESYFGGVACRRCPIKQVTGKSCNLEYGFWLKYEDPEPMIKLLNTTLEGLASSS